MANINRYDDLATGAIAYATLVSCIVLVVTILGVRALTCAWVEGEEVRKTANAHYVASDQEIGEQKARLGGYEKRMVEVLGGGEDAKPEMKEQISIPIDRAKELLLGEAGHSGDHS